MHPTVCLSAVGALLVGALFAGFSAPGAGHRGLSCTPGEDHRAVRAGWPDRRDGAPDRAKAEREPRQAVLRREPSGAGGNLGMALVGQRGADGYTLLMVSSSVVVNPSLYEKVPYDVYKSLAPVTLGRIEPEHSGRPSVGAGERRSRRLIAYVQANPGKVSFASPGFGTTASLAAESFKYALKLDIQPVPFNGAGPALNAVVAGQVPIAFMALPPVTAHLQAGTLRALAMTTEKRVAAAPDVPTMAEAGVPGDQISDVMQAVFAPAGTPKPIVDLLQKEIAKAVAAPGRQVEARFAWLRCYRRHAGAFRRAHQGRSAEMGQGDRGGQDRKGEIKTVRMGRELMKVATRILALAAAAARRRRGPGARATQIIRSRLSCPSHRQAQPTSWRA